MRRTLSLVAITLFLSSSVAVISQDGPAAGNKELVGAWKLALLEAPDASGNIHRADCTGLLVFSSDGHMSVQVMYRNPQTGGQGGPVQYAQGGYEASFGTYHVNDTHTFTFHVDGAMVRSLIGKNLPRSYRLVGNHLIVGSTNANEHWRVTWEHY